VPEIELVERVGDAMIILMLAREEKHRRDLMLCELY